MLCLVVATGLCSFPFSPCPCCPCGRAFPPPPPVLSCRYFRAALWAFYTRPVPPDPIPSPSSQAPCIHPSQHPNFDRPTHLCASILATLRSRLLSSTLLLAHNTRVLACVWFTLPNTSQHTGNHCPITCARSTCDCPSPASAPPLRPGRQAPSARSGPARAIVCDPSPPALLAFLP